jgi:hypothetical protein
VLAPGRSAGGSVAPGKFEDGGQPKSLLPLLPLPFPLP